ncbi:hemagglutinin repeat-containing protein [Neisseria yangbaofengii]|uniref:two-partner secretion domain-containing protein n=3 Tax=Neisseria yangbaofengii TaxID=2709396 RepID=UPI003B9F64AC
MNKTCYKVIFNKKRGMMMAVAENTARDGKNVQDGKAAVSDGLAGAAKFQIQMAAFSVWLAVGSAAVSPVWAAGLQADKSAPLGQQPTVLQTANGLPQVNIQTPTAGGVSVNQYRQFDVDKRGAILNNSRSNTQTKLAGWIQGNPWLARGEAKVIVNQVNSSNPSLLNGYIEVAGRRAEVVLANPAGIQVNGAGFINAAGVTLTTGKPLFDNGNLTGFQVRDGDIAVNGGGLDTSGADYTRLLARAAQINAGVWAKDLSVVSGSNDVATDGSHTQVSDGRPAPAVAIDTAQLGGMYANKITLVSTDKGAAVHHAGQAFATAGGVTLSADGKIGNSGSIAAADNTQRSSAAARVNIQATAFDNSGTVSSQGKTAIQSPKVGNSGLITSSDELNIRTQNLDNRQTIQAARFDIETGRLNNSGDMAQTGLQSLNIEAGKLNNSGLIAYAGQDHVSGNGGNTAPSTPATPTTAAVSGRIQTQNDATAVPLTLAEGRLKVSDGLENSGSITANGGVDIHAANSLGNTGKLHLNKLAVGGSLLDNHEAEIISRQAEITAQTLDNRQGKLTAAETLTIRNQTTDNREGTLQSGGSLAAAVQTLDNSNGRLTVNRQAGIKAAALLNQSGQIDTGRLKAEAARLDNRSGKIRSDEMTELKVSDGLDNQRGLIGSAKDVKIHDGGSQSLSINNESGEILAEQHLDIQAKTLTKQGELAANRNLSLNLKDSFTAAQDIRAGQGLTVSSKGGIHNSYTLEGSRFVRLEADHIDNTASGTIQSGSDTRLKADNITNRGLINSNGLTLLDAGNTVLNIGSGRVYGDWVAIEADKLVNQEETANGETKAAVIAAREHLAVGAKEITNQEEAKLSSEGSLNIGGSLDDQHQAQGMADRLINASATIEAGGDARIGVKSLKNLNNHFQTGEYLDSSKHIISYTKAGEAEPFFTEGKDGTTRKERHDFGFIYNDGTEQWLHKYAVRQYYQADYIQDIYKQEIVENRPGQILVGGNLNVEGKWLNHNSMILTGGTITDKTNINNQAAKDTVRTVNTGMLRGGSYDRHGSRGRRHIEFDKESSHIPNPPATHPEFTTKVSDVQEYRTLTLTGNAAEQANLSPTVVTHGGSTPAPIKTLNTDTKLPTSSLYAVNPAHPSYLVETDPAFANYKQWLGSDYMLNALKLDPSRMHKRLGDGYYEQKLVNEQVARLTGYRRLDGYANDEAQFKALMEAGITFAREQQLTPGIALSPEQVARLTSDIVWLETQTLTLIDGSTVDVLAPKVYLTVKPGDINAHGGLISADKLAMNGAGSIVNSGTLAGRKIADLSATDITNSGVVQGGKVRLRGQDVNIEGGTVAADTLLAVEADRIRVASTTATGGDERNGQTQIDRVAGLYVNNASDGLLSLKANQSIDFVAANLRNEAAKGKTQIVSDGRIDLGTAKLEAHSKWGELSDKNHRHVAQTSEAGTVIGAAGDILLSAKDDLTVRQGSIASDKGRVTLSGRNVDITEGRQTLDLDESIYTKSRGIASKTTSLDQYRRQHDEAVGSEISGGKVLIAADNDLTVRGSNVVSDGLTVLTAGNDVNITAAQSTYNDSEFHQTKKSGLMGSGGIGFTVGSKKDTADSGSRTQVNHAATVGSLTGDTIISAEQNYRQTGSTVSSPEGDVLIRARNIDIEAAQDTYATDYRQTLEQKGLTVAVNVPVVQAVQNTAAAAKTVGKSNNGRVNAMAAANAAWQTRKLLAEESSPDNLKGLANTAAALSAGDWQSAANASNVSVSLTYGQQKNTAQSHSEGSTAQSSQVIGGGQVSLIADEGRLNITGSDAAGKEGTLLRAKDIVLQSAEQSHSERSDNKSSSRNAGVAVAFQSGKPVIGFTAGGNHGKGYGNGDDLTHRHTHIGDKDSRTVIQSSGDTTLKGAQVYGRGVALSTRNLNIESIQDSAVYRSKQQNLSGSVTVGYGASATADYNQSKTNADHRSISEQSGIFAGDDGFQVNVANHTDLKGGIITATETAETAGRNRFQTASISHSDIENHSRYEGDGFGIGVSGSISGQSLGQTAPAADSRIQTVAAKNGIDSSIGYGSDGGSQSSVTKSGIGTRNIIIGNDTDGTQAAAAYTATRSETAEQNSGRLNNIFDKERVQSEIDLQRKVSQEFSKNVQEARTEINRKAEGYKALAKAAEDKAAQALQNGDLNAYREAVQTANEHHQKADNWQKGGVALAAVATGLSAPTDSALGIAAATASPAAAYQIGQYFKELAQQNSDGKLTAKQETAHILAHTVLGAATAAAGDNNALAGTISAGSAEAAAPLIGNYLYGEKDGSKLTAEQKETVTAITNLLGTATGAAVGNSTANAVQGSLNADSAVGNNHLSYKQAVNYDKELKSCSQSTSPEQCRNQVKQRYALLSDKNLAYAISVCSDASQSSKCSELRKQNESDAVKLKQDYLVDKIDLNPTWDKIIGFSEADLVLQSISLESAAKYWLQTGNSKPLAQWMSDQGYTLISGIHPKFVKLPKGVMKVAGNVAQSEDSRAKNYTLKSKIEEVNSSTHSTAQSSLQGARLTEHLRQLEKYGKAGFKELENGRIRYYGDIKPARKTGEMIGARLVREWNPLTDSKRTWYETIDNARRVRSVAPKPVTHEKNHHIFDKTGKYQGRR